MSPSRVLFLFLFPALAGIVLFPNLLRVQWKYVLLAVYAHALAIGFILHGWSRSDAAEFVGGLFHAGRSGPSLMSFAPGVVITAVGVFLALLFGSERLKQADRQFLLSTAIAVVGSFVAWGVTLVVGSFGAMALMLVFGLHG